MSDETPVETKDPKIHSKQAKIISLALLLLIAIGAVAWFLMQNDEASNEAEAEEVVVEMDVESDIPTEEEIIQANLPEEIENDPNLDKRRSDYEAKVAEDPSIDNLNNLFLVCIGQQDVKCLQETGDKIIALDPGQTTAIQELIADAKAANGDVAGAKAIIQEIIDGLSEEQLAENPEAKQYWEEKLTSYDESE